MTGKIKNCPMCGRLFSDTGLHVCMDCYDKIERKEHEVIEYVRDHPKSKIPDICEATGAPEKMLKKMIREGRFIEVGVKMTYPCEKCGAPIMTGKLCRSCMEAMRMDLQRQSAAITASRQAERKARGRGMYSKKMMEVIKDGNDRELPKKRGKWQ